MKKLLLSLVMLAMAAVGYAADCKLVLIDTLGVEHEYAMILWEENVYTMAVEVTKLFGEPEKDDEGEIVEDGHAKFYYVIDSVKYYAQQEKDTVVNYYGKYPLTTDSAYYYYVPTNKIWVFAAILHEDGWYAEVVLYSHSVDEVDVNKTVVDVSYYNLAGVRMREADGVTIVVTRYSDGSVSARKQVGAK